MDIVAVHHEHRSFYDDTTNQLQTFVSIGTFRELQSVSMLDARKWRNPSCLDCTWHPGKAL
jgi:hypothetical protein